MTLEDYVRQNVGRLLRTAWAISGDWETAQDLTQDVLLLLQSRWNRVSQSADVDAYVNRMLINQNISRWRKLRRVVPTVSLLRDMPTTSTGGGDFTEGHAQRDQIARALKKLSSRQRTVLGLRFYAQMTDVEIANALGCSPGTVRSLASRALARMKTELVSLDITRIGAV